MTVSLKLIEAVTGILALVFAAVSFGLTVGYTAGAADYRDLDVGANSLDVVALSFTTLALVLTCLMFWAHTRRRRYEWTGT